MNIDLEAVKYFEVDFSERRVDYLEETNEEIIFKNNF